MQTIRHPILALAVAGALLLVAGCGGDDDGGGDGGDAGAPTGEEVAESNGAEAAGDCLFTEQDAMDVAGPEFETQSDPPLPPQICTFSPGGDAESGRGLQVQNYPTGQDYDTQRELLGTDRPVEGLGDEAHFNVDKATLLSTAFLLIRNGEQVVVVSYTGDKGDPLERIVREAAEIVAGRL